jgi:hypothetical protein
LDPTATHHLKVTMQGAGMGVTVDGTPLTSYGFNSAIVDGDFGLLSVGGSSSFDSLAVRTNDPAFEIDVESEGEATLAAPSLAVDTKVTMDVNGDGIVSPLDALVVINAINLHAVESAVASDVVALHYDVSGDNVLSAVDALLVINYLNAELQALDVAAEAESTRGFLGYWEDERSALADDADYDVDDDLAFAVSEHWTPTATEDWRPDDDTLPALRQFRPSATDKALDELFREI